MATGTEGNLASLCALEHKEFLCGWKTILESLWQWDLHGRKSWEKSFSHASFFKFHTPFFPSFFSPLHEAPKKSSCAFLDVNTLGAAAGWQVVPIPCSVLLGGEWFECSPQINNFKKCSRAPDDLCDSRMCPNPLPSWAHWVVLTKLLPSQWSVCLEVALWALESWARIIFIPNKTTNHNTMEFIL